MKRKQLLVLPLIACITIGLLVGCGNTETESANPTSLVTVAAGTYRTEATLDDVKDYVHIDGEITVEQGCTITDIVNSIDCDTSEVNSVSFSLNHVNTNVPGEYTGTVTVNVSIEMAEEMIKGIKIPEDAEDVSLSINFPVIVVATE